jgi:hypothetical protein
MGTDIHLYVERRESADAPWTSADKWSDDEYSPGTRTINYTDQLYIDRSYDTFAILAGVRNGSGFAGVRTGGGFVPISEPRGLPGDMSPELRDLIADSIEHTPTWLSLSDIQSYDWTQTTTKSGIVNLAQFAHWKLQGRPTSWSGGIGGPGIGIVDASDAVPVVEAELARTRIRFRNQDQDSVADWRSLYREHNVATEAVRAALERRFGFQRARVQVTWEVSYADAASEFLWKVVPRLWRLGSPENVRLVFYFDS